MIGPAKDRAAGSGTSRRAAGTSRASAAASGGPKRLRCAVYTRKSTEEGLDSDFNTLDAQREAGAAYVEWSHARPSSKPCPPRWSEVERGGLDAAGCNG